MNRAGVLAPFVFSLAYGQLAFDAVSIKPANPHSPDGRIVVGMVPPTGGPGTTDPGRIRYPIISSRFLLVLAFDAKYDQISGPSWMDEDFFEIQAVMPADTTKQQLQMMLQTLLVDRFKLKLHRQTKEARSFDLVVAKGGPKMKESAETVDQQEAPIPPARREPPLVGEDGFPVHPNVPSRGAGLYNTIGTKGSRLTARQQTMHDLARVLTGPAGRPVVDATGLTKKYDFILTFSRESATGVEEFPTLFSALQSQLGLKLESSNGVLEKIVVDQLEKTPTEN